MTDRTTAPTDAAPTADGGDRPRLRVTAVELDQLGAPPRVIELVRERFPDGADVTEALCVEVAGDVDWTTAAHLLLDVDGQATYREAADAARQHHDELLAAAFAAGADATAAARAVDAEEPAS